MSWKIPKKLISCTIKELAPPPLSVKMWHLWWQPLTPPNSSTCSKWVTFNLKRQVPSYKTYSKFLSESVNFFSLALILLMIIVLRKRVLLHLRMGPIRNASPQRPTGCVQTGQEHNRAQSFAYCISSLVTLTIPSTTTFKVHLPSVKSTGVLSDYPRQLSLQHRSNEHW